MNSIARRTQCIASLPRWGTAGGTRFTATASLCLCATETATEKLEPL